MKEKENAQVAEQIRATESQIADLKMQLAFCERALAMSGEIIQTCKVLEEALYYAELTRGEKFYPER